MTRGDTCLFEHVVTRAVVCASFLCLCPVATEFSCAHLRMAQVKKRLEICLGCLVQKRTVCFCPCTQTRSRLLFAPPPGRSILILQYQNPERVLSYAMHNPDEY